MPSSYGHGNTGRTGTRSGLSTQFKVIAVITVVIIQAYAVYVFLLKGRSRFDNSSSNSALNSIAVVTAKRLRDLALSAAAAPSPAALPGPAVRKPAVPQEASPKQQQAAAPPPRKGDPWLTKETCHILNDDTELCQYEGPLCVSQSETAEFIFVSSPPADNGQADERSWCYDARTFETSHRCQYQGSRRRENLPNHAYAQPVHFAQVRLLLHHVLMHTCTHTHIYTHSCPRT
jgi:hypothetical protein